MISLSCTLEKFDQKGEKSGWTYVLIPAETARQLNPESRKGFRVKGTIDRVTLTQTALLPLGEGDYILPVNSPMLKKLAKPLGAIVTLQLEKDNSPLELDEELIACLEDEPKAMHFFNSLAPSHQRYFSKWVQEAKTRQTRDKRITQVVIGLGMSMDFGQMVRFFKDKRAAE